MIERVVVLVRHASHDELGRVLSGRSEIALNEQGRAEAAVLAGAMTRHAPRSLHAGPRLRTRETAAAIATRTGLALRIAPELDEIDFGGFAGRSFDELEHDAAWRHWNAARDTARCPGGETMAEAAARAAGFLRRLPPDKCPAVCVTHCDVIRAIVVETRGEPYASMFALDCAPASSVTLAIGATGSIRVAALTSPPA